MKLSRIAIQPSELRRVAESVSVAPPPDNVKSSLSYQVVLAALDLGVIREDSLGNLLARSRASSRPIPNVDNLLWITAPDINADTSVVTDLAKRAGHISGSIMDESTESKAWWKEAFSLFSTDEADQAKVLKQMRAEANISDHDGENQDDGTPDTPSDLSGSIKQQLADIFKRHKNTGDQIDALIKDLRADLAARSGGVAAKADQIIAADKKTRKKKADPDDGPVTKKTSPPKPKAWHEGVYAADVLFARLLTEESMALRGDEVLEHALVLAHTGGEFGVTAFGRDLFEGWLDTLKSAGSDLGSKLRRGAGKLFSGSLSDKVRGVSRNFLDRMQDPVGTGVRNSSERVRIQNVLLAKSAISTLAKLVTDKFMRLPMGKGEQLLGLDRTPENRKMIRAELGFDAQTVAPASDPYVHSTSTATI